MSVWRLTHIVTFTSGIKSLPACLFEPTRPGEKRSRCYKLRLDVFMLLGRRDNEKEKIEACRRSDGGVNRVGALCFHSPLVIFPYLPRTVLQVTERDKRQQRCSSIEVFCFCLRTICPDLQPHTFSRLGFPLMGPNLCLFHISPVSLPFFVYHSASLPLSSARPLLMSSSLFPNLIGQSASRSLRDEERRRGTFMADS